MNMPDYKPTAATTVKKSKTSFGVFPETIIVQKIQSFLPVKEAARSCLVSKEWLRAWYTSPTLRFPDFSAGAVTLGQALVAQEKLVKTVEKSIMRYYMRNLFIRDLRLSIYISDNKLAHRVKRWLRVLANQNGGLESLHLTVWPTNILSGLAPEILSNQKLRTLNVELGSGASPDLFKHLGGADFNFVVSHYAVKCHSLSRLRLSALHVEERLIHELFSCCPLIEDVVLDWCAGFRKVTVVHLRRLKSFCLKSFVNVDVEIGHAAPCLRWFTYRVISLPVNPWPSSIDAARNLRHLHLSGVSIGNNLFDGALSSKFPFLEKLSLSKFASPQTSVINVVSDSLRHLTLKNCWDEIFQVNVRAPKLAYFRYRGIVRTTVPNFSLMDNLSRRWPTPPRTVLEVATDNIETSWFLRLKAILQNLCPSFLSIRMQRHVRTNIDLDKLHVLSLPSEKVVGELTLDSVCAQEPFAYFATLDATLSVCRPKYVCSKKSPIFDINFAKLLLMELITDIDTNRRTCCSTTTRGHTNKCWRHYLKGVEVGLQRKTSRGKEDDREVGWWPLPVELQASLLNGLASEEDYKRFDLRLMWAS